MKLIFLKKSSWHHFLSIGPKSKKVFSRPYGRPKKKPKTRKHLMRGCQYSISVCFLQFLLQEKPIPVAKLRIWLFEGRDLKKAAPRTQTSENSRPQSFSPFRWLNSKICLRVWLVSSFSSNNGCLFWVSCNWRVSFSGEIFTFRNPIIHRWQHEKGIKSKNKNICRQV